MAPASLAGAQHGEQGATTTMSAGAAVCCMCGDHGLAGELFRCRCCRARLQHRYCSDMYPRAAAYRRCNWCLRAPAPDQQGGRAAAVVAAADNNRPEEKRKTTASSLDEERRRQRREAGCSPRRRSSPPADELGRHHPVKKKHRAEEKTSPQPAAAAEKEKEVVTTTRRGSKDVEEVMRAGTKARVSTRVRVRRYKLLTEVISC